MSPTTEPDRRVTRAADTTTTAVAVDVSTAGAAARFASSTNGTEVDRPCRAAARRPWLSACAALMISICASPVLGAGATTRAANLDALFARLAAANNEEEGRRIEQRIWQHWTHHPNPRIDTLMQQVLADRRVAAFDRALSRIDKILALDSDYAEAYNQRATIAFRRGDDFASLTAIAKTLEREPRHFGALAGRAIIRLRQGKPALAIQSLLTAIEVHPFLRERHLLGQLGFNPKRPR